MTNQKIENINNHKYVKLKLEKNTIENATETKRISESKYP